MSTLKVGDIKHESFTGTTQLKLDSAGRVLVGTDTKGQADADDFTVANSGSGGITIRTGNSNNANIFFSDATSGSAEYAGYLQYKHDHDRLDFGTATSTRMTIDSSGRLLLGTTSNTSTGVGSSKLQISGTGADTAGLNLIRTSNDGGGAYLQFTKNRGGATQSGDNCGSIAWMGHDGTDVNSYLATIKVEAGATASSNTMRGDIIFETADGGSVTSERMRIDSSGLVGIGTTSPTRTISAHVSDSGANYIHLTNTGTGAGDANGTFIGIDAAEGALIWNQESTYVRFGTNNIERMRIDSSGNVGIGTTAINYPSGGGLTIYNATAPRLRLCNSSTGTGTHDGAEISIDNTTKDLYIENREGEDIIFYSGYERMRIDTNGTLCIGRTNDTVNSANFGTSIGGGGLYVSRNVTGASHPFAAYGNQGVAYIMGDGDLLNTNNSYGQVSDETLKQDIVDAASQWDDIKNIRVRKFRFKDNPTGVLQIGVVAQEIEKVSAGLVSEKYLDGKTDSGEKIKSVKYSVLHMKAVKALQEAMARIETLETKVAALEAK